MRGLACVLMFQTHCYDSWLGGPARETDFLMFSQLGGTFPAPLFLFLAGISFALVTDKLVRKGVPAGEITRTMARRGAEVFAFGLLFRVQEYLIAWGWAPWTDLLRVDVLNMIGISMILMALLCGVVRRISGTRNSRAGFVSGGMAVAALISLLSPPLWTTWRPDWLPWPLESYVNGVHNLGSPQPGLFPIFPWTAFAFAGFAAGMVLFSDWGRDHTAHLLAVVAVAGGIFCAVSIWLDHASIQLYAGYDYWHTSPNFFLMRVGILLGIAFCSYAWCRWGWGARGFSPLIQLGQTSLLVYWVHIEFVYGRVSLLPKRANGIGTASLGLLLIFLMMLGLSLARTRVNWADKWKSWRTRMAPSTIA